MNRIVPPRIILFVIIFTALVSGLAGPLHAYELTVSPPRIELIVEPGQAAEGIIKVTGRFDQPTRIRVSVGDWGLQPNGNIFFAAPGSRPRSLARWIMVSPAEFILTDGRIQAVRYRLQSPADITGGYWGVIFFQAVPAVADAEQGSVGVTMIGRLATTVYAATNRGAVRDGRVTGVEVARKGRVMTFTALFKNYGNLMLRLDGRFEIRDPVKNKIVASVPFADLPVLPDGTREITADYDGKDLPAGKYVLLAVVDYGGRSMVAGQKTFTLD